MVRYAHGTTDGAYPSFPHLRERIGENPARWLQYCEDGSDHRVTAHLNSMRSLERARNWQYVAGELDVADSVQESIDQIVEALSRGVRAREVAHDAAARLRALWHADSADAVREIQAAEVDGESRTVVVALANHRLDAFSESSSADAVGDGDVETEATAECEESTEQSTAPAREAVSPEEYDDEDYDRAVDLCRSFDADRLRELLEVEQERDQPRPAKLAALQDVLDEKTTTDMTTTTETADAVTGGTA